MTKGIFITATGTDVGKTFISALLVKKMRDTGLNCGYFKPALSGAEIINGKLIPGDCAYVLKTAKINADPLDFVSYVFEPAVSPHLAAETENKEICLDKIKNDFERIKKSFDYIVVEGAGGIVCPFNMKKNLLLSDIIKPLGLDTVIVANALLGSINSTVLTVEYAKQHNINIKGIVLNMYDENDIMQRDNKKCIEKLTGVKILATAAKNAKDIEIENLKDMFKEI